MRIWAGGTVHKNTYPESSQCQETGKHRLNLTYNSSSAFMLKLVYCERHKLTTVFSGMIYNPIPDLKFLFIPFLSSRGSYTEEVYHMRCPKKRRGRCFFSNLHHLSVLLQEPLKSHCQEPGLPRLCCPSYCLPLLESEIFGPQVFPTSTSVHTCPVDPLMRRLASPTGEGSVGGMSAAVGLQVSAVLGSASAVETLLPKVTLFPDSLQPLAETGAYQSMMPRTPVSAFLEIWA